MPKEMPEVLNKNPQEGDKKFNLKERLQAIQDNLPHLCEAFGIPEETGTEIFNFIYETADISQGILEGDSLKDILEKIFTFINRKTKKVDNAQRQEFKNQLQNLILDEGVEETNTGEKVEDQPKPGAEAAGKKEIKPVVTKKSDPKEKPKNIGEVLKRLMGFERDINDLKKDGHAKDKKWKDLSQRLSGQLKKIREATKIDEGLIAECNELITDIENALDIEHVLIDQKNDQEQERTKKKDEQAARIKKYNLLKAQLEKALTLVSDKTALNDLLGRLNKLDPNNLKGENQISNFDKEVEGIEGKLKVLAKDLKIEDIYQEMREFVEKLGYVYIDPKVVMEKLSKDNLEDFKTLITKEQKGEVTEQEVLDFLKAKVGKIAIETGKEKQLDQEKIDEVAKNIFASIKSSIDAQARYNLEKFNLRNFGKKALKALPKILLFSGPALLIAGAPILGLGTLAAGLLGGSALIGGLGLSIGTTLYSMGLRKKFEAKDAADAEKRQEKFERDLDKKKEEALNEFFSNLNKVQEQLGAIISTEIRTATNPEAQRILNECQEADVKGTALTEATFQDIEKNLFHSALTKVRAEYPVISQEQQEHLAVLITQTLSTHLRSNNIARQHIYKLEKEKPGIIKFIENFNIFRTGKDTRKKEDKEKMNLFERHKYDALALTLGVSISFGARHIPILRNVLGAATGAYLGYGLAETLTRGQEQKAIKSIGKMIDEAEKKIQDIEFPAAKLPELREDAKVVESRLELGLLDSDPWMKTRAENFIFNVKQVEMANEKVLRDLLKQQEQNNADLKKQLEKDHKKIGRSNRLIKRISIIGGGLLGGLAPVAFAEGAQVFSGNHQVNMEDIYNSQPGATHQQIDEAINGLHLNDQRLTPEDYFRIISGKQQGDSTASNLYDHYNKAKGTWEVINEQVTGDANKPIILRDENGDGLPEVRGPDGKWHQVNDLEDLKKQIGYNEALADSQQVGGPASSATAEEIKEGAVGQTTAPEKPQIIENTISSSELGAGRHDSIWFSTKEMVMANAATLGFKGTPDQLDDWAEHQTANYVEDLRVDMGGKITDLVHDGDRVILEPVGDGKWHLKFVEDSGIKASYLPEKELPEVKSQEIKPDDVKLESGQPSELEKLLGEKTRLETQLQDDINKLKELHEHGLMTEKELQKDILDAQGKYRQTIGGLEMAIKDLQERASASGSQIEESLPMGISDLIEAHQGDAEAINFINSHKEMYPVTLHEVLSGGDILERNLGANISYERVLELHRAGYHVSAVETTNEMFPKETTVVFTRENHPTIYMNKDGECGYLVGERLMKSEHLLKFDEINAKNLKGIEGEAERINLENQSPTTNIEQSGDTEQVIGSGLLEGVKLSVSTEAREFMEKHGLSMDIEKGQFIGLKEGVVDFTSAPGSADADKTSSIIININNEGNLQVRAFDMDGTNDNFEVTPDNNTIHLDRIENINRGSNTFFEEDGSSATQQGSQTELEFTDIVNDFQGRFGAIKMNFIRPELLEIQDKEFFDAEQFRKTLDELKGREAVIDQQLDNYSEDQNITATEKAELERLLDGYNKLKMQADEAITTFDNNLGNYLRERAGALRAQGITAVNIVESDVSRGLAINYLDASGRTQQMQFEDPAAQADPRGYIEEKIKEVMEKNASEHEPIAQKDNEPVIKAEDVRTETPLLIENPGINFQNASQDELEKILQKNPNGYWDGGDGKIYTLTRGISKDMDTSEKMALFRVTDRFGGQGDLMAFPRSDVRYFPGENGRYVCYALTSIEKGDESIADVLEAENVSLEYLTKGSWQERVDYLTRQCGDHSYTYDTEKGEVNVFVSQRDFPGQLCYTINDGETIPITTAEAEKTFSELLWKKN